MSTSPNHEQPGEPFAFDIEPDDIDAGKAAGASRAELIESFAHADAMVARGGPVEPTGADDAQLGHGSSARAAS